MFRMDAVRTTAVVALIAFSVMMLISVGHAGPDELPLADLETVEHTLKRLAERFKPAVVAVRAMRLIGGESTEAGERAPDEPGIRRLARREPSLGSGMILTADGMILTNEHVVHLADEVTVLMHDGLELPARLVGADPRSDLAVLHIDADNLQPVQFGDADTVRPGQWAIAIGDAFGLSTRGRLTVTVGSISAVGRSLTRQLDPSETRFYGNLIQTTAVINPGNSGGPLFDIHGRVIGINTAISTRSGANEGVGFAVPIDARTLATIDRLKRGETVEYGFLGVLVRRPSLEERRFVGAPDRIGAIVKGVEPGSSADNAGLEPDDIICEFNGRPVNDDDHLVMMVGDTPAGTKVPIKFYRNHALHETVVVTQRREIGGLADGQGALDWGGMTLAPLTSATRWRHGIDPAVAGMLIVRVEDVGPARDSGLRAGQVVTKVDDLKVRSLADFRRAVSRTDEQVKLHLHDGRTTRLYLAAGVH